MRNIKIAVADDHILFRQGIVSLLNEVGGLKVIFEAGHGLELMEKLKKKSPDVILMDIQMPVMDGIKATKMISVKYPEIKIIILTMHDNQEMACHLMENGASGFLAKNTDIEIVIEAVFEVKKKGYFINERTSAAIIHGRKKLGAIALSRLSFRETEILKLICKQKSIGEIAKSLEISPRTVESHKKNILMKTKSKNTAGIVLYAVNNNLIGNMF
jgi:two-component system, NarL family, response regulator DegU